MSPRIVGFSGSTRRPSRTRSLVEAVAAEFSSRRSIAFEVHDLVDAGPGVGAFSLAALPREARAIIAAIEEADGLIVGSPVYKGSYAGLFKHLIDFVDPLALAGKPVVITATGGGHRHALVVEHQLRPLFGFFSAQTAPTAIYASDHDFQDGILTDSGVRARVAQAAIEFDRAVVRTAPRPSIVNVA
ncbi:FMN reductase [Aquabacter sp. CN5-332]|uniref:FMN reductase n=1 Tax=Aquabacter sp. CN5-332 TaxID=3156608 RepID=UPI0032B58114